MKHVYTVVMPIRWGDMDAMGHVNNTVYFQYLEQARIEWLRRLGAAARMRKGRGRSSSMRI